jgi:hypothetical protein
MKYILKFEGATLATERAAKELDKLGVTVVDSSPTMLLVQGSKKAVLDFQSSHDGWLMYPYRYIETPTPKPRIRRTS